MKPDTLINGAIGIGGTGLATIAPEKAAAIFAGVCTGLWMLRQLWLSFFPKK